MLTKEHLKFKIRSGRIKPELLIPMPPAALSAAEELLDVFRYAPGQSLGEIEETSSVAAEGQIPMALRKLLLDACDVDEEVDGVEDFRWDLFRKAQALRLAEPKLDVAAFQTRLGAEVGLPHAQVKDRLYGDLPACRRVRAFKDSTPEALVHRYNLSQVQGLLLRARSVTIKLKESSLGERRELFRQIKFRRLIAAVVDDGKKGLVLELSGPLGLLDQASAYGMRLASFFPHVLHLSRWEMRAEVHINNKEVELRLDETCGLQSHYTQRTPYIPEEMTAFMESFNQRSSLWRAEPASDFVHIGRESYCFPDLTISGYGRRVHVELFHRWHAGTLLGRLQSLEKSPVSDLYVGVGKSLAKHPDVAAQLASSAWFAKYGFIFSEFPTPKAIASLLSPGQGA